MRQANIIGALITLLTVHITACSDDLCELVDCSEGGTGAGAGGSGAGGNGTGGGTGGQGGEGGSVIPAECNPTEGQPVGADCGVFVKSGSNGDGTQASPFGSITGAVQGIGSATRIYVCGGDTFTGSVELPGGVSLYGGFDCTAWSYGDAAPKPTINGDVEEPALKIMESGTSVVQSMKIESPDAGTAGSSSIAVMVSGATVRFDRCSIRAGDGASGKPGEHQNIAVTPAAANAGPGGTGCVDSMPVGGGASGELTCAGSDRSGGVGGSGGSGNSGGMGSSGTPAGANNMGGKGKTTTVPLACANGGFGDPGTHGTPGSGALATDQGTVDEAGYVGASGQDGLTAGDPGQGGGGGGGGNSCSGFVGPGGGGGGAGGCGGLPGQGGGGGGGSFGLVILAGSDVTLVDVTVKAGAGGMGGAGDSGQEGMEGGTEGGAGGGTGACPGGHGGKGGQGGAGGGGRGGPSVAIAYVGDPPTEMGDNQVDAAATPAAGGDGGDGGVGNTGGPGAEGATAARLAF